jgi:3-deoxy-D-manno-octulosonic-acid transferase
MKWIFNLVYILLIAACSPLLVYKMVTQGKYRTGWKQKFLGLHPVRNSIKPCLWLHAVSVGEVLQLEKVILELKKEQPETEFLITTTTVTGFDVALKKYPEDQVCYFPLDFSWAVSNAMKRIKPSAIVLVELELWPNFILAANQRGIPLALINGRMSDKSFRGYLKIRPLIRMLFSKFQQISVQTEEYANKLEQLGVDGEKIQITGSIKFDHVETSRQNPKTIHLKELFGIQNHETVLIAGSTQAPEEEYILQTYQALKSEFPDLRLIIVPRHKERFEQVAELINSNLLPLIRRSKISQTDKVVSDSAKVSPVLLLDTLGELSACWGLADIAFVGGSLGSRGGQNMIEPSGYGAAVLFGPNTKNFRDVVELLLQKNAAKVVLNKDELTEVVHNFLSNPEDAVALGERAKKAVLSQKGATAKTVESILTMLPEPFPDGYQKVKHVA